jgi:hypothetical protein
LRIRWQKWPTREASCLFAEKNGPGQKQSGLASGYSANHCCSIVARNAAKAGNFILDGSFCYPICTCLCVRQWQHVRLHPCSPHWFMLGTKQGLFPNLRLTNRDAKGDVHSRPLTVVPGILLRAAARYWSRNDGSTAYTLPRKPEGLPHTYNTDRLTLYLTYCPIYRLTYSSCASRMRIITETRATHNRYPAF